MFEPTREFIAYAIIGTALLVAVPWTAYVIQSRRRGKLRRRGIKKYGH
jgi:hypothetical protein